jgi:hypothetical protein
VSGNQKTLADASGFHSMKEQSTSATKAFVILKTNAAETIFGAVAQFRSRAQH